MGETSIQWTNFTWNPMRGCDVVSPGCHNCYAKAIAARFSGPGLAYEGLAEMTEHGPQWTGKVALNKHLADPLRMRKPRRIFVTSVSDPFHSGYSNEEIAAVFGVMAATPQHTYQLLTKRLDRALEWYLWLAEEARDLPCIVGATPPPTTSLEGSACLMFAGERLSENAITPRAYEHAPWPLPNVHLIASTEDQPRLDERVPKLLQCPAAVHGISAEPLLGPLDMSEFLPGGYVATEGGQGATDLVLDWVVVGGESGTKARPFHLDWARSIVSQCKAAGVPVFVKQVGKRPLDGAGLVPLRLTKDPGHGGDASEWPADLRVREFPNARTT